MDSPERVDRLLPSGRHVRLLLAAVAVIQAILAILFMLQVPWALEIIPFAGRSAMSNTFVASILMAAAASTGWCLLVRSDRAMAGIALDYVAIFAPTAVIALAAFIGGEGAGMAVFVPICLLGVAFGALLLRWALRHPWRDPRPTPRIVLGSFVAFIVVLLIASALLIAQVPKVLPWSITPQLSTLFGLMFLGAAAYFAYGVLEPRWENAGGQLAGFLAYDVVLIVPFLRQMTSGRGSVYDTAGDGLSLNLVVYLVVVLYSGALAAWFLLVRRGTRAWSPRPEPVEGDALGA